MWVPKCPRPALHRTRTEIVAIAGQPDSLFLIEQKFGNCIPGCSSILVRVFGKAPDILRPPRAACTEGFHGLVGRRRIQFH